ncbi:hypothetical protein ACP70R_005677 [Stipagrostis hirtigluma subsp. patula]
MANRSPPPPFMGEDRRRRPGEDRISGLPDELLHGILVRLRSARAAARTGVLSRRWRHVWAQLPELVLDGNEDAPAPASFLNSVDAVLAACSGSAIERLEISLSSRVVQWPWVLLSSKRLAGTLRLDVPRKKVSFHTAADDGEEETIFKRLQFRPAGLFTALTDLRICVGRMEGSEITALVSTQCPRLKNLGLSGTLVADFDVSIRSNVLESLSLCVGKTRRLEVICPNMEELDVMVPNSNDTEAHISAPKLAN